MKPRLQSIFPNIPKYLSEFEIEKIFASKQSRKLHMILADNISDDMKSDLSAYIKENLGINGVKISSLQLSVPQSNNDTVKVLVTDNHYVSPERSHIRHEHLNKGEIINMIYGRTIKDDLISISAINENSKKVTFRGEIFSIEYKDIKSKKMTKNITSLCLT